MSYRGMMDGWHGDEMECHGHCGLCEECKERDYQRGEEQYEVWRNEVMLCEA